MQTHKRLTFVLVSSTCHSSIGVSLSPCTVSRCDQIGLLLALSDRRSVPFISLWRLRHIVIFPPPTISHFYRHVYTICAAPASAAAAAAAAAAAPWHSITISVT